MRFNEQANAYNAHARIQRDLADWASAWLEPVVPPAATAVELGAGTGLFTQHVAKAVPQLVATDVATRMVDAGRQDFPQIQWRVMDAWSPTPEPWDRIYSSALLQWAPDPEAVLSRWRNYLRPGGRMLHAFFVAPTLPELGRLGPDLVPLRWHPRRQWEQAFVKAGFHVERAETDTRPYVFNGGATELLRALHGTGAVVANRASPGRLRQLLRRYDAECATAEGVVSTWTFFRIECTG